MIEDDDVDASRPHLPGAPRHDAKGRPLLVEVLSDIQNDRPAPDPPRYGVIRGRTVAALLASGQGYVVLSENGIATFTLLDPERPA